MHVGQCQKEKHRANRDRERTDRDRERNQSRADKAATFPFLYATFRPAIRAITPAFALEIEKARLRKNVPLNREG